MKISAHKRTSRPAPPAVGLLAVVITLFSPAGASEARAQGLTKKHNPLVQRVIDGVSEERIAAILKKLEGFGTRNTFSETDHPTRGIGAARRWIHDEFKSYSPRLQVRFDPYKVKKQGRIFRDVEIVNVVAVLPGTMYPDRHVIISGHYDSLNLLPSEDPNDSSEREPEDIAAAIAPGVTDDASGTAATMELARVMSQFEFDKTVVFIALAAEEYGLVGSSLYAAKAREQNQVIEAVLNNDIIGSEISGNGRSDNHRVRVFSEEPSDSLSRQLARYVKKTAERYMPSMNVDLVFRRDRFSRGGDHTSFNHYDYAAVRFTTPNEHYGNQHSSSDTFANTSPAYTARVTRVNAAALASLALAPSPPMVNRVVTRGRNKGRQVPNIGRGDSRYDAVLRWECFPAERDLAGYAIVVRSTTAPYWEREIFVGSADEYTMKNVSIDDLVFGVKAVDNDGNESLVSAYVEAPRSKITYELF